MITQHFPALTQLFGCYFHQYWPEDYGSPDGAINAYLDQESDEAIISATHELKQIIDSKYSEAEAMKLLDELGCYYNPVVDNLKVLDWLISIKDKLA